MRRRKLESLKKRDARCESSRSAVAVVGNKSGTDLYGSEPQREWQRQSASAAFVLRNSPPLRSDEAAVLSVAA